MHWFPENTSVILLKLVLFRFYRVMITNKRTMKGLGEELAGSPERKRGRFVLGALNGFTFKMISNKRFKDQ